jgi:hypothetical protein
LYECETWSYILREESIMKTFEKTLQRGLLGTNMDEQAGK